MIIVITFLVIVIDQLSKYFFSQYLAFGVSVPVVRNVFHLTLVRNTGIAFGMFKGNTLLILSVTIIGLVLIVYSFGRDYAKNTQHVQRMRGAEIVAVGFIFGGAIANMIDRLRFGYVIDFFDFRVWPVFNVADSCITIGASIVICKMLFSPQNK